MEDIYSLGIYLSIILISIILKFIIFPLLCYIDKSFGSIDNVGDILNIFKKLFKSKNKYKKYYDKCEYFRDIPNRGDLSISYFLISEFKCWKSKENHIISAMILRMILDKNIQIVDNETTIDKRELELLLKKVPEDKCLKELYDILDYATIDDILETDELKDYIKSHYEIYDNLLYVLKQNGKHLLMDKKYINDKICYDVNDLTQDGKNELSEIYGFRKYLDDFTLINEHGIDTTIIWEDLLVYATLLGLGNKLYNDIKNICPKNIEQIIHLGKLKSYSDYIDDTMKTSFGDNWLSLLL